MMQTLRRFNTKTVGLAVAVLMLFCGVWAVRSVGNVTKTQAAEVDTVEKEIVRRQIACEGVSFQGKGVSGNKKAVLCIDLTPDSDSGLALPTGEKCLAVSFTGLRNTQSAEANAADSMATVFFLEDSAGNRADTVYETNPNYKAPVLEYAGQSPTYASAQMTNVGLYYRVSSARQLAAGTAFIPFSALRTTGDDLTDVKYLMLSLDLGNPWRWLELTEIAVTVLQGITADLDRGMLTGADGVPAADDAAATFIQNKRVLYDFTAVSDADIAENFADGVYTTMLASNRSEITRANCTADNAAFASALQMARSYEQTTQTVYVDVKTDLVGALKIAPDPDALGTQNTDETADNYDKVMNAFTDVWSGDAVDVSAGDGVAFKLMGLSSNAAFRLYLYDTSGRVYYVGVNATSNDPFEMPFVLDNGDKTFLKTYSRFVWADQKAGTAYMPYDALTQVADNMLNGVAVNKTKARISDIYKVAVAMDNSQKNFPGALNRKFILGSVADVRVDAGVVTRLFDTSTYTYAQTADDQTSDVNPFDPTAGKTVKPDNRNDAGEPQAWKNDAWQLGKAVLFDVMYRTGIQTPYIGDVRVYEDFALPTGADALTQEEKSALVAKFANANGATSYFGWYDNSAAGYGDACLWTIGDYNAEYATGMSSNASWYTDSTLAADFASLRAKNARGETIVPKGVTIFVKNLRGYALDMNFEVEFITETDNGTKRERWECCMPGSDVYAYDTAVGREFRMPSTSDATNSTVSIPAGFEGWLRVPFSSLYFPSWLVGNGDYATDGSIDFEDSLLRFFINCHMNRNSGAAVVLDNYGFYYSDFSVKSSFHDAGATIADCLAMDGFFGADER